MRKLIFAIIALVALLPVSAQEKAYIFSYFDNSNQSAGLLLAYSYDGYHWTALNDGKPIITPAIGDKIMRDPSICQSPDGTFHMVWTTSWHSKDIGYASSADLIHWSDQRLIEVMKDYPSTRNSWAPELYYDAPKMTYHIFWASTVPGNKRVSDVGCLSEDNYNHRIYSCTTKDFKKFSKTKLFYNPHFNAIDAAIVKSEKTGELIMAVKNEGLFPPEKNIRIARSKRMKDGFPMNVSAPIHGKVWCEGPSPLFVGEDLIVFFDKYCEHRYGASVSHDQGMTWEDATDKISMPEGMSHGTAIAVDKAVVEALIKWNAEQRIE